VSVRAAIVTYGVFALVGLAGCSRRESQEKATPTPESSALASAATPASAAPSPAPSARPDASAGRPFGSPCVDDAECSGGVCFHKRIKGPDAGHERRGANEAVEHDGYCSLRCNDDAECPVPPTKGKCGARGMCKRPE
jgi:hypothetical protein